ncbi:hypothetical protein EG328_008225 [Venturia inaequalis]|uniref:Uncharacterized protein n=1 Tax=Venturia inaequalis TaxID=5025 RepID=A0A8H3VBT9_VENIN|nr:hypothetical protein EG328_008225 [Venturia inaequalis]
MHSSFAWLFSLDLLFAAPFASAYVDVAGNADLTNKRHVGGHFVRAVIPLEARRSVDIEERNPHHTAAQQAAKAAKGTAGTTAAARTNTASDTSAATNGTTTATAAKKAGQKAKKAKKAAKAAAAAQRSVLVGQQAGKPATAAAARK